MVDQLKVNLGTRSYLLHFGEDLAGEVRARNFVYRGLPT